MSHLHQNIHPRLLVVAIGLATLLAPCAKAGPTFESVYSFSGGTQGANPDAALVQGSDGNFYGTTRHGGASDVGTVFRMTPSGALTTLVEFTGNGATNKGSYPYSTLVQRANGSFFGMTLLGGAFDHGTVFKITSAGVLTTLVEFTGNGAANKGSGPSGALVLGSDGNFYGTTEQGGTNNAGTVFVMTPAGALQTRVDFGSGAASIGEFPDCDLLQGSDGNFYGTTAAGGSSRPDGSVFKMTPAGQVTTLVDFSVSPIKGDNPTAGLTKGTDGNFYGTTVGGGGSNSGTVFKVTTDGTAEGTVLTTLVEFTGNGATNKGRVVFNKLLLGGDGDFYGVTNQGGTTDAGTLFKMTPAGALTTLVNFAPTPSTRGSNPHSELIKGTDGNFYGTTEQGGKNGFGTIFRLRFGPTPVTKAATFVASTSVTLNGTVNPHNASIPTNVTFQYGTSKTLAGATTVSAGAIPGSTTGQIVNLPITGLTPNTKYYCRITAQNADNTVTQLGLLSSFTTLP